ncbi:hypothetical protein VD0002_g3386 [Verticillium dahliae]|uniref:Uncharacterized protein n=2 Tax=Verticillium dahliae TaxID=27337 RepID=G2X665_VERDV|nr:uncharacterized protein VDAG_05647 [Verticillium dahliae VdLs.17]KAF3345669.1 Putative mannose-1-phosphate guanyltransferase [Verticillium dahliae VDG2]KAH6708469.1 hypothetical protein EV126DRAFT_511498 [Verticillium dahliae]EGY14483.1 hypothetical protein VDAG_05647 [Verticillium dahliae VdLs.17]PNH34892.1 hypothetical protein BJF96_g1910 [Verticillium dahliae]PNH54350.1 hypothetical protein VD0003_g3125 [Verticillium dahliae]
MTLSSPSNHSLVAVMLVLGTFSQTALAQLAKRNDNSTPAERKRTIAIVIGTIVGVGLVGGLILLAFLHRRMQRRDRKEAEDDAHLELEGDIDDSDYPAMPRPSKQREGQAPANPFEPPRDRPYENGDMK